MKLLNLGCGTTFHKDWINIDFVSGSEDVIKHNLLNGIPLDDDSVEVVYHSHVLEHFSKSDGRFFISECFRVLKKNGILRIAVPDLEIIAKEYLKNLNLALQGDEEGEKNYDWIKLELLDQMVRNTQGGEMLKYLSNPKLLNEKYVYDRIGTEGRIIRERLSKIKSNHGSQMLKVNRQRSFPQILRKTKRIIKKIIKKFSGKRISREELNALQIGRFRLGGEIHQWMYDRYSLRVLLEELGFEDIKVCSHLESRIPNWKKYQLDSLQGKVRKPDSLFIEAVKK